MQDAHVNTNSRESGVEPRPLETGYVPNIDLDSVQVHCGHKEVK